MKTIKIFIVTLLILNIINTVSAQITFEKGYGSFYGNEEGFSLQQISDNGFIICGVSSNITDTTFEDVYLIRTDSLGDTLWSKRYGTRMGMEIGVEVGFQARQTYDNGFIVVGGISIQNKSNSADVYLIKTDSSGNLTWSKSYGGNQDDIGHSVDQTSDSGFIIAGSTESFGAGSIYLIKTDKSGNELWSKTYSGGISNSVKQTLDSGYIICGVAQSGFGIGGADVYLIKTDNMGNLVWSKTFGGTNDENGQSVYQTLDNGYIIVGATKSFGAGNYDVYLIKTDGLGNMLWSKTFGNTADDYGESVMQTNDGGYIIGGVTHSVPNNGQVYLVRTDDNGILLWSKIFGQAPFYGTSCAVQTMDGGFIITSTGNTTTSLILIKTDANGISCANYDPFLTIENTPPTQDSTVTTIVDSSATITSIPDTYSKSVGGITNVCIGGSTDINETTSENAILISPNPCSNSFFISGNKQDGDIIIFDLLGKEINRYKIFDVKTEISTMYLKAGFYILQYNEDNKTRINMKFEKL